MELQVNEVTLYYKKSGTGPPLILLHGNGEDHQIFDRLTSTLTPYFTVYGLDSRNHGKSEKTNDFSYDTMTKDLGEFIKALGLTDVNLVGFSDGAIVSLLLAMKEEKVIRKMVLLGINLSPTDFIEEYYKEIKVDYKTTKNPLLQLMLEEPNIPLSAVVDVKTPSLIVAGEHDVFSPDTFITLADALPNATLKIMKEQTHDSYVVNSDALAEPLLTFLK